MMKEVSAHFSSISRITGHHVEDLPSYLAGVLSPAQLQLALNMLRRVEAVAEAAAAKVQPPARPSSANLLLPVHSIIDAM